MPTPNVYLDAEHDVFAELDPSISTTQVKLFYITDREPKQNEDGILRYGTGRSASLAFGTAMVDLGVKITWEELLDASRTQQRVKPLQLELREVKELIRTPNMPIPYAMVDGIIVEEPGAAAELDLATETFRRVLVQQLALTPRKEVFIYVHGYHNTFEDTAFSMAELWHFLGRIGVPIVYSWPSGYPGLFGYTHDRESSEFTITHLREVLSFIASLPEVDKIHLIAHSRGTDVTVDALRELTIAARAAGFDPREKLKIHNLVLAAPDLDVQVATQRFMGDKLDFSVNRWTIYTSPADKAIGASAILYASPRGRVGTFDIEDLDDTIKLAMDFGESVPSLAFINFSIASNTVNSQLDRYGHSYFLNAPTVSSDLVLMLRDDLDPGDPGRPLEKIDLQFWRIPSGYPNRKSAN